MCQSIQLLVSPSSPFLGKPLRQTFQGASRKPSQSLLFFAVRRFSNCSMRAALFHVRKQHATEVYVKQSHKTLLLWLLLIVMMYLIYRLVEPSNGPHAVGCA